MKIRYVGWLLFLLWLAGAVTLGLLAGLVSTYFVIALLLYFFAIAILITRLRCPNCGRPVYLKQLKGEGPVGAHDGYWSPFMAKRCIECGTLLLQAIFEWKMFRRNWKPESRPESKHSI